MIRPTEAQNAALVEAQASATQQELRIQKVEFIGQFLRFAAMVARPDDRIPTGRVLSPSGQTYWQSESTSRAVDIGSEPDSPSMGVEITAYTTGLSKDGLFRIINLGSRVHAADVNVGVLDASPSSPARLLGATTMLRVIEHPPAVYYGAQETKLTNVEPDTEAWGEVTSLVEQLYTQEQAFTGNSSIQVRTP